MKISKLLRYDGWRSVAVGGWWIIVLAITFNCFMLNVHAGLSFSSIFHKPPTAGYVRTKAYIEESPEIGIGFHKVPIMVPLPMLIFRKKKHLITKPLMVPICPGCSGGTIQLQPASSYLPTTSYLPPSISSYGRGVGSSIYGGGGNGGGGGYSSNSEAPYKRR